MTLLLYLLTAGGLLLVVHRWLVPLSLRCALVLLFLPAIFTGPALVTERVYAPMDMVLHDSPLDAAAARLGLEAGDAPRMAGDIPLQIVPWHHAVRHAWSVGDWPLWNPRLLAGDILAAAAQPAPYHPVNLLALLLPADLALTYLASIFVFAAGLGAFVFARDLECRELAALVAAAAWGWSSFVTFWLLWPLGLTITGFLWVLAAVRRLARAPHAGHVLFLAAAFLWALLAGHPESVLHMVAAGAVYGAWEVARHALAADDAPRRRQRALRAVGGALVAGVLALAASAIFLLPHLEALPQTEQYEGRRLHFAAEDHSLPLRHAFGRLRASLVPFVHGVPWEPDGRAEGAPFFVPPSSGYVGSVLFVPILFGLLRHPWPGRWLLAAFAAVGALAGASFPVVTHALAALPLFDLSIHKRWVMIAAGSLAVLAGLGAEAWARQVERRRSPRGRVLALLALVVVVLAGLLFRSWPGMLRTGLEPGFLWPRIVVFLGLTVAAGVLLALPPHIGRVSRATTGLTCLLLLLAVQRGIEAGDRYPTLERQAVYPRPQVFDRLPATDGPSRIAAVGDLLPPNLAGVYGLADVRGYEPMALRRFVETYPLWAERHVYFNRIDDLERPFLSFLGVRHALVPVETEPPPGWRPVVDAGEGDVRWLENERALPLAFVPGVVHLDPSARDLRRGLAAATDFAAEAWIGRPEAGAATTQRNAEGSVSVRVEGTGYRIATELGEPGWIVTSIPDWTGWRVFEIAGDEVTERPTATANHAFVAFRAGAGERVYALRYLPRSFVVGRAVSFATLGLLLALLAVLWLRRDRADASIRSVSVFAFLVVLRTLTRLFYRFELRWLPGNDVDGDPWAGMRVACFLHHTSLFDVLFLGALPLRVLRRFSRRAVAPGADVTLERPILGPLLRFMLYRMIPISRKRDETWDTVLDAVDEDALVVIAPEGRMMRRDGLDKNGRPMTVRGGIADILEKVASLPDPGRLVLAYSQGVHHVQAPGERLPRVFRTLAGTLDSVPVADYVAARRAEAASLDLSFRDAVVRDLEARRDRHCPVPQRDGSAA